MWSHVGRAPHRDEGIAGFVGFGPTLWSTLARPNTVSVLFRWARYRRYDLGRELTSTNDRAMYKQADLEAGRSAIRRARK